MTGQVNRISHATNNSGTTTKSAVKKVSFPTSSNAGKPVTQQLRNSNQLKLFGAAQGFARVQLLGFVVLSLVLLGVFFYLPNMVEPPDPKTLAKPQKAQAKAEAPPDSPWQDAQMAKQRRQAQEVLSKILAIQSQLEEKKVELWAAQDFKQAMDEAAIGDTEYRARNFEAAQQKYHSSLTQFEALQEKVDSVFNSQMARGLAGIEQNNPIEALDSYQMALYLKPESLAAQRGLQRAQTLGQVMELVADGRHLMKTGDFNDAKTKFKQALDLDQASKPAKEQLQKAQQAITDENFANAMSEGYNAINQKQFANAIKAFNQALKIRPKAEDAQAALRQAQNSSQVAQVSTLNDQAKDFEAKEMWHKAQTNYEQMLNLDKSLLDAKIGVIRTKARAELDSRLQTAIDKPERLTSKSVYDQSLQTLVDANQIKKPGARLLDQIERLEELIAELQVPVPLKIKSNNQTTVTLYKVGNLGSFTAKQMDLKPGKYTLVGTREGFRDVRTEITLMPSTQVTEIVVQCDEKITNG